MICTGIPALTIWITFRLIPGRKPFKEIREGI
jgi:hypothetical protein